MVRKQRAFGGNIMSINQADVIQFTQAVCTTSKEQHTQPEKHTEKKILTLEKEFQTQLKTMTATQLRTKYPQEYNSWRNSKSRAKNKELDFSPELQDWAGFLGYMGQAPDHGYTVDRIDNSKGYVVGNLRWASKVTQANNKTNNKTLTVDGTTLTVAQWAKLTDTSIHTIRSRLKKPGWSDYEVVYGKARLANAPALVLGQWSGLRPNDIPNDFDWPTPPMIQRYTKFRKSRRGKFQGVILPPSVWLAALLTQNFRSLSGQIQSYYPMEDGDVPEKLDRDYDRIKLRLEYIRPLAAQWCQSTLYLFHSQVLDVLRNLET